MERTISISLQFRLATGKVTLNEIVYRLKELRDPMMLRILEEVLSGYDTLICDRLSGSHRSSIRKGLGRHFKRASSQQLCRGRRVRKRGYRSANRHISTVFGTLTMPLRTVECKLCGARYSPLLSALEVGRYSRKEGNFEQHVLEAVIDTNYRRLTDSRSIDISLGGIHNLIVESDADKPLEEPVNLEGLSAVMADGTGLKLAKGKKGELRAVIGVTTEGRVEPLGCFTNTEWPSIEKVVKNRIKDTEGGKWPIPFVYDGEPGLDNFLADVTESQRCTWHGPRGLYHAMWADGLKKKDSQEHIDKMTHLIGIELPEGDYELLKDDDKEQVHRQWENSKKEVGTLIETFREKGYHKAVYYLENLSERMFTHVEIWLRTGVIAPKTTSLLERVFRELGRRLKKIAWGWSDETATKLSKMILLRQYSRNKWIRYWKEKLGIEGNFEITISNVSLQSCPHI